MSEEVKPKLDLSQIGSAGLRQYGGFVDEEFLKELRGAKGAKVYREMADNDPIVGAIVFAFTMLLRQMDLSFQAADETPAGETGKEFAESVFDDMTTPVADVVDEIASMFTYGWAAMEIVWKRRTAAETDEDESPTYAADGKVGIKSISLRAQPTLMRWEIEPETEKLLGMWQQPYSGPAAFIPIEKMLLFRTTSVRGNPEGRSLLRTAYRSWFFKKRIEEVEGVGVERDLAGLPVAAIPGEFFSKDADNDQKRTLAAWKTMVRNVRRDQHEGVVVPSTRDANGNLMYEFKLMSSGGTRAFDTSKIIDRYNRGIATATLADFIFLGQNSVGSFALSSDKTALFAAALGGFVKSILGVFNRHLMPRLWALNGFDPALMPVLTAGDIEHPNLAELAQFITALAGAGAALFPDRDLENFLRDAAGMPPAPEEGENMPTPIVGPGAQPQGSNDGGDDDGTAGAAGVEEEADAGSGGAAPVKKLKRWRLGV